MFEDKVTISNPGPRMLEVTIEPWGGSHSVRPGQTLLVVGSAPEAGRLMVEDSLGVKSVWGWSGSTVRVLLDGRQIEHYTPAVP